MRDSVKNFAKEMETILELNDFKGGWDARHCTMDYLQHRLVEELGEYFRTLEHGLIKDGYITTDDQRKELVDIANFAMMLWERTPKYKSGTMPEKVQRLI